MGVRVGTCTTFRDTLLKYQGKVFHPVGTTEKYMIYEQLDETESHTSLPFPAPLRVGCMGYEMYYGDILLVVPRSSTAATTNAKMLDTFTADWTCKTMQEGTATVEEDEIEQPVGILQTLVRKHVSHKRAVATTVAVAASAEVGAGAAKGSGSGVGTASRSGAEKSETATRKGSVVGGVVGVGEEDESEEDEEEDEGESEKGEGDDQDEGDDDGAEEEEEEVDNEDGDGEEAADDDDGDAAIDDCAGADDDDV